MRKQNLTPYHSDMAIKGIERGFVVRVDKYGNLWFRYSTQAKPKDLIKVQISALQFGFDDGKTKRDWRVVLQYGIQGDPIVYRSENFDFNLINYKQ